MEQKNALVPNGEELNTYQVMAKKAMESKFFDKLGGESGILSIMLMARELGIPPMQAVMGGMNVILGKVEISPRLMNMMIRKAGHKLSIEESTGSVCKIKGIRSDTKEEYTSVYTIEEARNAGLIKSGGGWDKFPSDMLFARCLSRLARRLFTDVISSAYVEGEISESENEILDKPEPLPKKSTSRKIEPIVEAEMEVIRPSEMSVDEFVDKLREKVGDKYTLLNMHLYLSFLEQTKQVPMQKIMEQALNGALLERFCKGWQKWYNEINEVAEESLTRT